MFNVLKMRHSIIFHLSYAALWLDSEHTPGQGLQNVTWNNTISLFVSVDYCGDVLRRTARDHRGGMRDYYWDRGVLWAGCSWYAVFVCVLEYLDVLHHVPQLNQELLGLSGSVWQAVESLRQLTLGRAQREDIRDTAAALQLCWFVLHSNNNFTMHVSWTVLQGYRAWKNLKLSPPHRIRV